MRREGAGSGRDDGLENVARKVERISSSSTRNVSHGSGGNGISSLRGKVDVVEQSRNKVPTFNYANPGSNGEFGDRDRGRLGKRRRSEINVRHRVDLDIGSDDEYMDPDDIEIEKIDEAEFRNKRTHSMPRPSTEQESDEGYSAATSRKHVAGDSDKYMDLQDIEIERITKAEFIKKKSSSLSKIRTLARQESNEGYPAATHKKTSEWMKKKIFPTGLSGSILPENAGNDSNHWLLDRSSSFVKIGEGNGHEDMVPCGVEIEKIDEAKFRTETPRDISKIGPANRQEINEGYVATPWKKVARVGKNIYSSALCGSLSPKDANNNSDQGEHNKWSPCVDKGNDDEDMDPEKVVLERIDEAEFRNKKTHSAPKIAASTRTKQNERYYRKKVKCVNKRISNFHFSSLCCVDVSINSNGDPDKSSSFMKDENDDEDMDPEKVDVERIDEAEFRNKKTHSVPKGTPSTRQKPNKRYSAVSSGKKVKCVSKKICNFHFSSLSAEDVSVDSNGDPYKSSSFVKKAMGSEAEDIEFETMGKKNCIKIEDSIYFRRKKIDQEWDKNLHYDVNSYHHEWINSNPSIQSYRKLNPSGNDDDLLKVEKICSSGSEHDNELSIANRARSKTKIVKPSPDVDKYSSSSDSFFESKDDEDFRVDNFSLSDSYEPRCYDVQKIESVKVSVAKCSYCRKQERTVVWCSSKKWHFPNLYRVETKCNQLSSQERGCSFRKKQLRIDASSKRNEEGTSYMPHKVPEENYDKNKKVCDDSTEEEVFKIEVMVYKGTYQNAQT
ncbi:uncharacterized protein LOC142527234 isoform X1 [Primulina tabacum]|uniref:uncharacterized protein LOC142527234 isoform X1 n=1 Tax=Primulina tabacum TaxID=48773 RepID=UPI003F5A4904